MTALKNKAAMTMLLASLMLVPAGADAFSAGDKSKLFGLVKTIDTGRPLTRERIEQLTGAQMQYSSADHFASQDNPGKSTMVLRVHAGASGSMDLELKNNSGIKIGDVEKVFGRKHVCGRSMSLVRARPVTDYVYENERGWIAFDFDKFKKQELYCVHFTDRKN